MVSKSIKTTVEVEVHPNAYELAEVFWSMGEEEQASFFHRLYEVSGHLLPMQLHYVANHKGITTEAKRAMEIIGEYSNNNY